jgi:hypothetical protein
MDVVPVKFAEPALKHGGNVIEVSHPIGVTFQYDQIFRCRGRVALALESDLHLPQERLFQEAAGVEDDRTGNRTSPEVSFPYMEGPKRSELQTPGRPVVWISHKDGERCTVCGTKLRSGNFIRIARDTGIRCLTCPGLSDLVFLGSGDAALTRRAVAFSSRKAVVVKKLKVSNAG